MATRGGCDRIARLAGVMELADIRRLKRLGPWPCGFEPRRPHPFVWFDPHQCIDRLRKYRYRVGQGTSHDEQDRWPCISPEPNGSADPISRDEAFLSTIRDT